ncbi:MAG: hypothetical protein D6730_00420 [Bacteroidetes bacterium]|nr:MAG: hypothetical protein D6730_00420 [Bacteroidota bacterium]
MAFQQGKQMFCIVMGRKVGRSNKFLKAVEFRFGKRTEVGNYFGTVHITGISYIKYRIMTGIFQQFQQNLYELPVFFLTIEFLKPCTPG